MGGGGGFKVRLSYEEEKPVVAPVPVGGVPVQIEVDEGASGGGGLGGFVSALLLSCFGCFSKPETPEAVQSTRAPVQSNMERT
jgi:hypothetical protein